MVHSDDVSAQTYVFGQPFAAGTALPEPAFETQRLRSPLLPLTAAGLILFLWAAFLPLYRWYHILLVLILALTGFFVTYHFQPCVTVSLPVVTRLPKVRDRVLRRRLKAGKGFLSAQLYYTRTLARVDPALSACLSQISGYTWQILRAAAGDPASASASVLTALTDYDLPALELILGDYRSDVTDKAGLQELRAEAVRAFWSLIFARRAVCFGVAAPETVTDSEDAFHALAERLDAVPSTASDA